MAIDPGNSNAIPSDDASERGNSGEGKDPRADDGEQRAGSDATGTRKEKDDRAFDHPGKPGPAVTPT